MKSASGGGLLTVSWLVLVLLIGGAVGWLLVAGEVTDTERESIAASVVVKLPPPIVTEAPAAEVATEPPEIAVEEQAKETVETPTAPAASAPPAKPDEPAEWAEPAEQTAVLVPPPIPPAALSLPPAPDPALVEESQKGPLPAIGQDGREPWQVYARPFDGTDTRPKIAIVVNWLGLSDAATEAAIQELPGGVTLAFAPYAENLTNWVRLARAAGHEVLLNLPMEPLNYPTNDPGPQTLLTSLSPARNLDRLEWTLSRVTGYVGVTNYMGSRFTTSSASLKPVLKALKGRGLLFLDSRSSSRSLVSEVAGEMALPWVANNRFLDNQASRVAIDAELEALEAVARSQGHAVGIGFPYPVTLERLAAWIPTLQKKGFVLAPISAIAQAVPAKPEKSE
ncbi:MAG: divergent polysaccharide deacetylase family protein [Alphaproteobacteria bacterium]|nr:divergent polysaccharide deacetylase family protein [Alphaproteobacteria bacterium]